MAVADERLSLSPGYLVRLAVPKVLLLDGFSVLLMWCSIAASRTAGSLASDATAEPLAAFLALPLIVVIPRQIGMLVWPLVRQWRATFDALECYILQWLAGITALIIGLTIVTGVAGVPSTATATAVLVLATASVYCGRFFDGGPSVEQRSALEVVGGALPYVGALALVAAPVTLIRLTEPFPMQVGWGLFSFNFHVLEFTKHSEIAIAPGLHTPIHASLLGVMSITTGVDPEGLLWAGPVLLYASFAVGVFVLARRLSGSTLIALGSVWIAVWILSNTTFQHLHGFAMRGIFLALWPWSLIVILKAFPERVRQLRELTPYLAYPLVGLAVVGMIRWSLPEAVQPWALLVTVPLAILALRRLPHEVALPVGVLTFVAGVLTFIHIIEGPLYVGMGFLLALGLMLRPSRISRVATGALFALISLFIILQVVNILTFSDASILSRFLLGDERADAIPLPFDAKFSLMEKGLTYTFYALIGLSAVRLLMWPNRLHGAVILVVAVAFGLYYFPESGLHRIMGPVIPLIGLSVVLEFQWFAQRIVRLGWKQERAVLSGALVILALLALTPHLTSSLRDQVRLDSVVGLPIPRTEGDFAPVNAGEYAAADWIRQNIPADWVIVSDPMTMFITQGLTLNPQVANKRAWVAESEYTKADQARLHSLAPRIFNAPSTEAAREGMASLTEGHPGSILVISTRTLDWLQNPDDLFLRARPIYLLMEREPLASICGYRDMEYCPSRFLDAKEFSLIYNDDGVAIFVPNEHTTDANLRR